MRIPNRIATVTENGLEYEASQRHPEILMRDMGVDEGSKGVATPGVRTSEGGRLQEERAGGEGLLRAVAARGKHVGQDRVDVQLAAMKS